MKSFENEVTVGIRDKETRELIKVYPHKVSGDFDKISDTVMTWYYKHNCENGELIDNYYVDVID